MAKKATAVLQSATAEPEKKPTYQIDGVTKTLDEMFAVKTGCGHQRYVLLDESRGEPVGTLVDKLNPLKYVQSIEAQAEAAAKKRKAEGHRYESVKVLVLR